MVELLDAHSEDASEAGEVRPGDHVCSVVDGAEQLAERLTGWVREGLDRGERVVFIDRPEAPHYTDWLDAAGVDWRSAVEGGRLVILPTYAAYLADGQFDVERCLAQHAAFIEQSMADGYPAVRMAAEATVALQAFPDLGGVLAYEQGFEDLCRRYPVSGMCLYDRAAFEDDLPALAAAHPRTVVDGAFRGWWAGACIRLVGELDVSNVDLLAALVAGPAPGPRVDVDVRGLAFIDVAGTGILAAAARRWAPASVRIVGASPQLRTIVNVGKWRDVLDVVPGGGA